MIVRYLGKGSPMTLKHGKLYRVDGIEKGWYRIVDESGEDYLYPPDEFEVVKKITNPFL
ncbi:hypothetical protein IJ21_17850 [Paenibacillus sp. 32O-W]|uniref:hypothetical protein n=1 Tax=Paenibacillus sp. 32O-W TaxID=1695218 RepID=UPI0007215E66|nr:hypothetical protein [Paenibacillus sp. 32O-W]ALS27186.1 hypothetical protein IJ21_17850 [Paenibacillus sp. 32O-W]